MLALKRIVTVAVMVYLLAALLFLLFPAVRATVGGFSGSDPYHERDFFRMLCWIGVGVLGLHLLTENLDSILLRRTVDQQDSKINELKAKLYDTHATTSTAAGPAVAYPTAASAAATEHELRRPNEPTATPPTI